jgi:hypothetical protein
MPAKFAISIAVENYTDTKIKKVAYASDDAKSVAAALIELGVPDSNSTTLIDKSATKTQIESVIRNTCAQLDSGDELFLFYAGHGWADGVRNYITCHDTLTHDVKNTVVSLAWVLQQIKKSKCTKVWLFLDACHSGWQIDEGMRNLFAGMTDEEFEDFCSESEHHLAFAACKMDQSSYSSTKLKHGIWTYHLIEALEGRALEALVRDRYVTATSLQNYLKSAVPVSVRTYAQKNSLQTPITWGSSSSESILADLEPILAKRSLVKKISVKPRNISFSQTEKGKVRDLDGFKKGFHHVPDDYNDATSSFVRSIGDSRVDEVAADWHQRLRSQFGYKRKEIDYDGVVGGSAVIRTPDFTLSIYLDLNRAESTEYTLKTVVEEFNAPGILFSDKFNSVFDGEFNRLSITFDGTVDVTSVIDALEAAGHNPDYDSSAKKAALFLPSGQTLEIRPRSLAIKSRSTTKIQDLLNAVKGCAAITKDAGVAGLLSGPGDQ